MVHFLFATFLYSEKGFFFFKKSCTGFLFTMNSNNELRPSCRHFCQPHSLCSSNGSHGGSFYSHITNQHNLTPLNAQGGRISPLNQSLHGILLATANGSGAVMWPKFIQLRSPCLLFNDERQESRLCSQLRDVNPRNPVRQLERNRENFDQYPALPQKAAIIWLQIYHPVHFLCCLS